MAELKGVALDETVSALEIGSLDIATDISQALIQKGYKTLGELYDLQAEGISLLIEIDLDVAEVVWQKVLQVISNPDQWSQQKDTISFIETGVSLPVLLPSIIEEYFTKINKPRIFTILVRRFGLNNQKRYTLEDLGFYFDVTRERVRQLEKEGINLLKSVLSSDDCQQTSFIHELAPVSMDVIQEIQNIKDTLERQGSPIQTEQEIFSFLAARYRSDLSDNQKAFLRLVFTVFGWKHVENSPSSSFDVTPFWIVRPSEIEIETVWEALKRIIQVIREECIAISYFDLKIKVNKRTKFSDLVLRSSIRISPSIDTLENDSFQLSFHLLRGAPDQAFRVLSEHGDTMTTREVHREVAQRLALAGEKACTVQSLGNAMATDARFLTIGKGGWALAEWEDVYQGTIVQVMKEFFAKHNKPAKEKEIFQYVREKRRVSRQSIAAYLITDHFVRVDRGLYQPIEWKLPKGAKTKNVQVNQWTKAKAADLIVSIFDRYDTDTLPHATLFNEMAKVMDVNPSRIYAILQKSPAVQMSVLSEHPRRIEARVIRDYKIERAPTLRDRLEATAREILKKQPEQTMPLIELRNKVTKRGNIQPHTFYHYLSDMPDIQKHIVEGSRIVLVTLVVSAESDDDIQDIWDRRFTYDIAVSYAGKERQYASTLTEELRKRDLRVFYDRNQLPDLIGENLWDELLEIYRDKANLCIILASRAYNESLFAQHERRSAQDRARKDKGYIFLTKLDDVEQITGFHDTVAYVSWAEYRLEEIVSLVVEQLKKRRGRPHL